MSDSSTFKVHASILVWISIVFCRAANRFSLIAYPWIMYCFKTLFAHLRNAMPRFEFTRYPTERIISKLYILGFLPPVLLSENPPEVSLPFSVSTGAFVPTRSCRGRAVRQWSCPRSVKLLPCYPCSGLNPDPFLSIIRIWKTFFCR